MWGACSKREIGTKGEERGELDNNGVACKQAHFCKFGAIFVGKLLL